MVEGEVRAEEQLQDAGGNDSETNIVSRVRYLRQSISAGLAESADEQEDTV